jgi:hypothetical protein
MLPQSVSAKCSYWCRMNMLSISPPLFFDRAKVDGFAPLLAKFPAGAFASPYRSTVPLMALVKDDWATFNAIVTACGLESDISVHFEYKVTATGIHGNPSQTDAMVLSPTSALAIEAKWTEPRYETVSKRLKSRVATLLKDDPCNAKQHYSSQLAIIRGWLAMLDNHSSPSLAFERAGDAIYQMIHRAASACAAGRVPRLAYLHFESLPYRGGATTAQYRTDLKKLHELMGSPASFHFYLVELPLQPTAGFRAIENLSKGTPDTDRQVRDAIRSTRLFDFGDSKIERIG